MKGATVFGLVKGRFLSSGRRLYSGSVRREVMNHILSVKGNENLCRVSPKIDVPKKVGSGEGVIMRAVKRYGIVYIRKRKRLGDVKEESSTSKAYETRSSLRLRSHNKKAGGTEVVSVSKRMQSVVLESMEDKHSKGGEVARNDGSKRGEKMAHCLSPTVGEGKLADLNAMCRNGFYSNGIRKRRSSFRRRKARNPVLLHWHNNTSVGLVSDLNDDQRNSLSLSSHVPDNKLSISLQGGSAESPKKASSNVVGVEQSARPSSCFANLLIIESDRCYRIMDAMVMMETSDFGDWVIAVKKDGSTRCIHLAQKIMRPCSSNRITHDIIWTADENWKLEFPNKQDWLIFKDLYKECSNRNVPFSTCKFIPAPEVREVLECQDQCGVPFTRPDDYIRMDEDEVSRAMTRKTAIYDLDSDDEKWLKKLNNESFSKDKQQEHLSDDTFELMVDVFEKAMLNTPDDIIDKQEAANLCTELGKREVVEAVYCYWTEKRKKKQSALLRVFQEHQVRKGPLIPKPALRKRRSFRRQLNQIGRGKEPVDLQATVAKQCSWEDCYATWRFEEAKFSMMIAVETAILKRRRARLLMRSADFLVYKAAMALKISEAALAAESTDIAVDHMLV